MESPARRELSWQLMRLQFTARTEICEKGFQGLSFDFAKYMRKKLSLTVAHAIHISITTWVLTGTVLICLCLAWGYTHGCEHDDCVASFNDDDANAVAVNRNISYVSRRQLGGGTSVAVMHPSEAKYMVMYFGLFGWTMLCGTFALAWLLASSMEAAIHGTAFWDSDEFGPGGLNKSFWTEAERNPDFWSKKISQVKNQLSDNIFLMTEKQSQHEQRERKYEKLYPSSHGHSDAHSKGGDEDHDHHGFVIDRDWIYEEASSAIFLLNCFYIALYILQVVLAVGWTKWPIGIRVIVHVALLVPPTLTLLWLGPTLLKSFAVLESIKKPDGKVIDEVLNSMDTITKRAKRFADGLHEHFGEQAKKNSHTYTELKVAELREKLLTEGIVTDESRDHPFGDNNIDDGQELTTYVNEVKGLCSLLLAADIADAVIEKASDLNQKDSTSMSISRSPRKSPKTKQDTEAGIGYSAMRKLYGIVTDTADDPEENDISGREFKALMRALLDIYYYSSNSIMLALSPINEFCDDPSSNKYLSYVALQVR
jgi:hypothetical protein